MAKSKARLGVNFACSSGLGTWGLGLPLRVSEQGKGYELHLPTASTWWFPELGSCRPHRSGGKGDPIFEPVT